MSPQTKPLQNQNVDEYIQNSNRRYSFLPLYVENDSKAAEEMGVGKLLLYFFIKVKAKICKHFCFFLLMQFTNDFKTIIYYNKVFQFYI